VLEALSLELGATARGGPYDSRCVPFLFPTQDGNEMIAHYAMCWWSEAERLAGKAGNRSGKMIHFVDPRKIDINHVVGYKGTEIPAFLYHFAGRSKDWTAILEKFGLPHRHTLDCNRVFRYVDEAARKKECIPGNEGVKDLFTYCEPPLAVC